MATNNPMTREEFYLAAIAGENVEYPAPQTRKEGYLAKIADNAGGGGESKNFYLLEFDDTDQAYYVQNITTGEWDEEYGGAVSQQLYEEFQQNKYDVMSRVSITLGPVGGVYGYYKPIGVQRNSIGFIFYAHGSTPINRTVTWDNRWQ